ISISPQIELSDMIGKKQEASAEGLRAAPIKHGYMLFPGDFFVQDFNMEITEEMLVELRAKNAKMNIAGPEDPVWPILYGCVSYRSPLGDKRHTTGFFVPLRRADQQQPSASPTWLHAPQSEYRARRCRLHSRPRRVLGRLAPSKRRSSLRE